MWIPAERDGQTWDFEDFNMYFTYTPTYLIVLVFITINFYLSTFITYYCHYIMSTICTNSFIIINVYECIICVSKRTEREMSWRAGATPWFPISSSVPENFCKAHARFYSGWWINGISNHVPSLAFSILSLKTLEPLKTTDCTLWCQCVWKSLKWFSSLSKGLRLCRQLVVQGNHAFICCHLTSLKINSGARRSENRWYSPPKVVRGLHELLHRTCA